METDKRRHLPVSNWHLRNQLPSCLQEEVSSEGNLGWIVQYFGAFVKCPYIIPEDMRRDNPRCCTIPVGSRTDPSPV